MRTILQQQGKVAVSLAMTAILLVTLQPVFANGDDGNSHIATVVTIDTDGDGYVDCVEKGKYRDDADNDGIDDDEDDTVNELESTRDRDDDGIPDYVEKSEYRHNHDNTGKDDVTDLDDDDDGNRDRNESSRHRQNHDNAGKSDKNDSDDDNDGVADLEESACQEIFDHDNDNESDKHDSDDDEDGIDDDDEEGTEFDHDNDGTDDKDDADDDQDGIDDEDEDEGEELDHDNDGVDDGEDTTDDSIDSDGAEPTIYTVTIDNMEFSDDDITLEVGDSIKFTNNDSMSHTATAVDGSFNTGTLAVGESETITFDEVGTFDYYCNFHEDMTGTITVEAAE